MSDMKSCPCCGITSSAGDKATKKYYSILEQYSQVACASQDQRHMVIAAKEYMDNIALCVLSSSRPNGIAHEKHLHDLQQAFHLLCSALEWENKGSKQ